MSQVFALGHEESCTSIKKIYIALTRGEKNLKYLHGRQVRNIFTLSIKMTYSLDFIFQSYNNHQSNAQELERCFLS